MSIIGIAGKARAGKNQVGHYLADELRGLGYSVTCTGFADAIKKFIRKFMGYAGAKDDRWRWVMQIIGAHCRKNDLDFWINKLKEDLPCSDFVIITDVRYMNEFKWCRLGKGVVWRVTGRGGLEGAAAQHESETELDSLQASDYDAVIVNDSTLEVLRERVHKLVAMGRHDKPSPREAAPNRTEN